LKRVGFIETVWRGKLCETATLDKRFATLEPRRRRAPPSTLLFNKAKRVLLCFLTTVHVCFGGARHFTFLYEAPTAAPGSWELENYATSLFDEGKFIGMNFRHEFEIGITDHFQASIYVANWNYDSEEGATHYESASAEFISNLTNPVTDPAGISLYEELGGGCRFFESETKLIAQKNFGPLILLYNFTVEAESEGEGLGERTGEIQNAVGACYEITPQLSFGAEALHEVILPDWHTTNAEQNFFIGPNVSWRSNRWFSTITGLKQLTKTEGEADYQVRMIFGVSL
jgi:hypothetical protein